MKIFPQDDNAWLLLHGSANEFVRAVERGLGQ